MSSNGRPWYKWYPKDFIVDEKVQCLSAYGELIYRRALDVMWQSSTICLPNDERLVYQALGKNISFDDFKTAWDQIMYPDWSLFIVSVDGKWIFSKRLKQEYEQTIELSKVRKNASLKGVAKRRTTKRKPKGKPNGKPSVNHTVTDTDTDTDNKEITLKGAYAPPSKDEIENESSVKLKEDIDCVSKEIYEKNIFPKVTAWINTMRKSGKNDRAILHTLLRCIMKPPKESCWAYCTRIINVENGNFNERDNQKNT